MKSLLLRRLYTTLFYLLLPIILLRQYRRARHVKGASQHWLERLAYFKQQTLPIGSIWIHAVSVGEFNAACPLIKRIREQFSQQPLLITTTTATASARVTEVFGDQITHLYAPYDLPMIVERFLKKLQPKYLVILETELWPNLLAACAKHHIPVLLANGRLSKRSLQGYRRIRTVAERMLGQLTTVAAQSLIDAERFLQLGLAREKLHVTGNLKFDQQLPQSVNEVASQLRNQWGNTRLVWIAASTHEGEDEIVLQAHQQILSTLADCC